MPQIPVFEASPDAQAGRMPLADPSAFASPGQALQGAGAAIGGLGEEWENRYVEAQRQQTASNLVANYGKQAEALYFKYSKLDDANAASTGFATEFAALQKQAVGASQDPLVQSYVEREMDSRGLLLGVQVRHDAFQRQASAVAGDLDMKAVDFGNRMATAPNDLYQAQLQDEFTAAVKGAQASGFITGGDADRRLLMFHSGVAKAQVETMMLRDPTRAANLLADPAQRQQAFPGLSSPDADNLAIRADNRSYRIEMRANAAQMHADAMAERSLRQVQSQNELTLYANVLDGKQVDVGTLADMARRDQIGPGAIGTIMAAQDRRDTGRDDPGVLLEANSRLLHGTLSEQDVHAAVDARQLKATTGVELLKGIAGRAQREETPYDRGNLSALRTAFSAQAVESGVLGRDDAPEVQVWSSVQQEWAKRVYAGREDSGAVLRDLVQRYGPLAQPEQPIAGVVANTADLNAVAVRTVQLHQAGQLDDAAYQAEVIKLNRLRLLLSARGGTLPGVVKPNGNAATRAPPPPLPDAAAQPAPPWMQPPPIDPGDLSGLAVPSGGP